jgi:5-hydroxyisourate hydrolase
MAGQLTTHALDLVSGRGAAGLIVRVQRLEPSPQNFGEIALDDGGRAVLAAGEAFQAGAYELVFKAGAYHRAHGLTGEGAFLDEIPVRFAVADASQHCHVPILLSLYGYSIYRGG